MRKSFVVILAALAAVLVLCLVPPFHLQALCMLIALAMFVLGVACAVQNSIIKSACITVFALVLVVCIFEGDYYRIIKRDAGLDVQQGGIFEKGLAQPHPEIGYAPVPGSKIKSRKVRDGQVLYDVTYTINSEGWRVTPEAPTAHTAVLLFGCSFTFAEGLEDQQALAWKLGEKLGKDYKVFNFGFSGYGPHHMLAIIEKALPDLKKFDRVIAYHIAIEGHQRRVAGVSPWDKNGPRYMLEKGEVVRKGTFADLPPLFWEGPLAPLLERSFFFKGIKQPLTEFLVPVNTLDKRMDLTRGIIAASAKKLQAQYPGASFTVLAWPPNTSKLLPPLKDVPMVDVETWFPGYAEDVSKYIIPKDRHPSALANELAAEQVAKLVRGAAAR